MDGLTWRGAPGAGLIRLTTRPAGQLTMDVDGAGGLTLASALRWLLAHVPGLGLAADDAALIALAGLLWVMGLEVPPEPGKGPAPVFSDCVPWP